MRTEAVQHHYDWMQWIPFVLSAGENGPKLSLTRIIESIVIAVVCGGVAVYAAQQVIESRLDGIEKQQSMLRSDIHELRRDLYIPHNRAVR